MLPFLLFPVTPFNHSVVFIIPVGRFCKVEHSLKTNSKTQQPHFSLRTILYPLHETLIPKYAHTGCHANPINIPNMLKTLEL